MKYLNAASAGFELASDMGLLELVDDLLELQHLQRRVRAGSRNQDEVHARRQVVLHQPERLAEQSEPGQNNNDEDIAQSVHVGKTDIQTIK